MPLTTYTAGEVLTAASLNANFTFAAAAGAVKQVKYIQKTDTFTTSSTSFVDLTTLTLSITPSSASNKILIGYAVQGLGLTATNMGSIQIVRTSTAIGNADAAGSRSVSNSIIPELAAAQIGTMTNWYLDSPATTSATTYKLQIKTNIAGTVYVNRTITDTDTAAFGRGTSSLVVMEVAP
jgi:hypothetical protein